MKRTEFEQVWNGLVDDQFGSNSKDLEDVTAEEYAAAIECDD